MDYSETDVYTASVDVCLFQIVPHKKSTFSTTMVIKWDHCVQKATDNNGASCHVIIRT